MRAETLFDRLMRVRILIELFLTKCAISAFSDCRAVCVCVCLCMCVGGEELYYIPGIQGIDSLVITSSDSWIMCLILMRMFRQPCIHGCKY